MNKTHILSLIVLAATIVLFLELGLRKDESKIDDSQSAPKIPEPKSTNLGQDPRIGVRKPDVRPSNTEIFQATDPETKNRLEPWFEAFRSEIVVGDPITEYQFVTFSNQKIQSLRNRDISQFQFRMSNEHDYTVVIDDFMDFDGGWIIKGYVRDRFDGSQATILVVDDGSFRGDLFVKGVGRFTIEPTALPPHHVIYLKTGSIYVD